MNNNRFKVLMHQGKYITPLFSNLINYTERPHLFNADCDEEFIKTVYGGYGGIVDDWELITVELNKVEQ